MRCASCGSELTPPARFCPACGAPQPAAGSAGHVVAFDARMGYTLRRAARSGWIRSIMSGEALVAEFTGPGDLWLQTRNLRALAGALFPLFPSQQQGSGLGLGKLFD
jgi:hypothetical protein